MTSEMEKNINTIQIMGHRESYMLQSGVWDLERTNILESQLGDKHKRHLIPAYLDVGEENQG